MKQIELIRKLAELDRHGIYVLARSDVEKLFPEEPDKAMEKSLQRMVSQGLLQRVAKGLYLNPAAHTAKTAGSPNRSPNPCAPVISRISAWSLSCLNTV